jgi:hypothetical protein
MFYLLGRVLSSALRNLAAVHANGGRRCNPEADAIAANIYDYDVNVPANNDFLPNAPAEQQHKHLSVSGLVGITVRSAPKRALIFWEFSKRMDCRARLGSETRRRRPRDSA